MRESVRKAVGKSRAVARRLDSASRRDTASISEQAVSTAAGVPADVASMQVRNTTEADPSKPISYCEEGIRLPSSVTVVIPSRELGPTGLSGEVFGSSEIAARCVVTASVGTSATSSATSADAAPESSSDGVTAEGQKSHLLEVSEVEVEDGLNFARRLQALVAAVPTDYVLVATERGHILPKAVSHMLSLIEESGVDFVSAKIRHTSDEGDVDSPALADSHQEDGLIEFGGRDGNLGDLQLGNKLFRTQFLQEVLTVCVDNNLSDSIAIALVGSLRAGFYSATSEVALTVPYPSESAALRRRRAEVSELNREFDAICAGIRTLSLLGHEEMLRRWRVYTFDRVLSPYYQLIPRVSDEYWEVFVARLRECTADLTEEVFGELTLHNRVLTHLILADNRPDCEAVSYNRSDLGSQYQIELIDGMAIARPNYLPLLDEAIPEDLLVCRRHEIVLEAGIFDYRWTTPRSLQLTGCAYVRGVDLQDADHQTWLELVSISTGERNRIQTTQVDLAAIDLRSSDRNLSYARAGFVANIDMTDFPGIDSRTGENSTGWKVRVVTEVKGIEVVSDFAWRDRTGAAAILDQQPMNDGVRLVPSFASSTGLELSQEHPRHVVKAVSLSERIFTFEVAADPDNIAARLRAECAKTSQNVSGYLVSFDGSTAIYSLSLPSMQANSKAKGEWEWKLVAESADGRSVPLAFSGAESELEESVDPALALTIRLSGYGYIRIFERRWRILVSDCRVSADGNQLLVEGGCDLTINHPPRIVLANSRGTIEASESELVVSSSPRANRFSVKFDLRVSAWGRTDLARESGAYSLRFIPDGADISKSQWLLSTRGFSNELPHRYKSYKGSLEVSRTINSGAIKVHFRPNLSDYEFGRFGQRSLQLKYFTGDDVDLSRPASGRYAVIECFGGRRVTDTVLELIRRLQDDYPDVPIYCGVVDESVPLPESVTGVIIDSEEWYARLSEARLLINNNNFPHYFRKRTGQYYLQTWHGTPLKRLVFDVASSNFSLSYWALMGREAAYWDLLIAQNKYAAEVLAQAFRYQGDVFYDGYPRNDSLNAPDADDRRATVREMLGIDPHQNVALYAPTWRDNAKSSTSQYAMVTYLDFRAFDDALGDEWTILLRGHHNVANGRKVSDFGVIDVTDYPQVNDLYLAADILITDYSSVMFDFAVMNKQSVFLTPDIDEYSDSIRGFYFDLKSAAPGPMVKTTTGVIDAVKHLTLTKWRYMKKRQEFIERFAPRDDGNATERLYNEVPWSSIVG